MKGSWQAPALRGYHWRKGSAQAVVARAMRALGRATVDQLVEATGYDRLTVKTRVQAIRSAGHIKRVSPDGARPAVYEVIT